MRNGAWGLIGFVCGVISLIIAIIALAVELPAPEKLDFDYYGVIVGVLSFLVTALIGWNIYSIISIKEEIRSLPKIKRRINQEQKERKAEIELLSRKSRWISYKLSAEILRTELYKQYNQSLEYYVYALRNLIYSDVSDTETIEKVINKMQDVSLCITDEEYYENKEILKECINIIIKSGKLSKKQLFDFINIKQIKDMDE